jgi:tRNA-dihydrouridine synthase B
MAEQEGFAMVAVHGRTRCQFYKGQADWQAVHRVRDAIRIPLFVNGDIDTLDDVGVAMQQSGADGVMIGRAAMGRPWFIRDAGRYSTGRAALPEPDITERHAIMKQHLELMLTHYGTAGLRLARKHIAAYTRGMEGSALMRQLANNEGDAEAVFAAIDRFFETRIDAGRGEAHRDEKVDFDTGQTQFCVSLPMEGERV